MTTVCGDHLRQCWSARGSQDTGNYWRKKKKLKKNLYCQCSVNTGIGHLQEEGRVVFFFSLHSYKDLNKQ